MRKSYGVWFIFDYFFLLIFPSVDKSADDEQTTVLVPVSERGPKKN